MMCWLCRYRHKSHLLRDYQDCAESYPGAVWPAQAQRALRGLIHAWHAAREQGLDAIPAGVRNPLEHEFRHAVLAGLASVPRVPGPKNSTKQRPGRELLEFCRDRRSDVLLFAEDTSVWPTNNISVIRSPIRVHARSCLTTAARSARAVSHRTSLPHARAGKGKRRQRRGGYETAGAVA